MLKDNSKYLNIQTVANCCPTITAAHRRDAAGVRGAAVRDAVAAGCRYDGCGGCSSLSGLRMIHVHFSCLVSIFECDGGTRQNIRSLN